jgi:hypothetical protein
MLRSGNNRKERERERNILSNSSTNLLPQEYERHGFESLEATGGSDKIIFHQHQLSGEGLYVCHNSLNEHVMRRVLCFVHPFLYLTLCNLRWYESERILKEAITVQLSRLFSERTDENHKNTCVSVAGLPTGILIECKPRTSLRHQQVRSGFYTFCSNILSPEILNGFRRNLALLNRVYTKNHASELVSVHACFYSIWCASSNSLPNCRSLCYCQKTWDIHTIISVTFISNLFQDCVCRIVLDER